MLSDYKVPGSLVFRHIPKEPIQQDQINIIILLYRRENWELEINLLAPGHTTWLKDTNALEY